MLIAQAADAYATQPQFDHPFYEWIHNAVKNEDHEAIVREKILLKLLQLEPGYQEGFIVDGSQAMALEEYRGGLNAFIHLTLPAEILVEIEESKIECTDCGKVYYKKDVISEQHGVHIEKFMPHDGHCDECANTEFKDGSDPVEFEKDLESYQQTKDELLSFYNNNGLLIDFEVRKGYDSYDKLKRTLQYNIKH